MSGVDKTGQKTGQAHRRTKVAPGHQTQSRSGPTVRTVNKPDFDERDQRISPKRKAAGPEKRRRGSISRQSGPPATPEVVIRPETDEDDQ